jgi:hypothetical protein
MEKNQRQRRRPRGADGRPLGHAHAEQHKKEPRGAKRRRLEDFDLGQQIALLGRGDAIGETCLVLRVRNPPDPHAAAAVLPRVACPRTPDGEESGMSQHIALKL